MGKPWQYVLHHNRGEWRDGEHGGRGRRRGPGGRLLPGNALNPGSTYFTATGVSEERVGVGVVTWSCIKPWQ